MNFQSKEATTVDKWTNHDEAHARLELLVTDLKIAKEYYEKQEYNMAAIRVAMNLIQDAKLLCHALNRLHAGEIEWMPPK